MKSLVSQWLRIQDSGFRIQKRQRGFTLLELLVVIAIIAILAAVVVTNLNGARSKANDSKVQTDVNSLSQAINVATSTNSDLSALSVFDTSGTDNISKLASAVTAVDANGQTLIKKMPTHPLAPSQQYHYKSKTANGTLSYILWGALASGKCFIVSNGSSFVGDCTTDINL